MSIVFTCCCGWNLEAPDTAAGRRGKCSHCGRTVFVPLQFPQDLIVWSGADFQLLEAALHRELPQLALRPAERILDEAEKWSKLWKLPRKRKPFYAGVDLICDVISSCVMRDATVGMNGIAVLRTAGAQMVRVSVLRGERKLLHFVARSGPDEYLFWHHREVGDEETENDRERTDLLQLPPEGVHCDKCEYNIAFTQVTKEELVTTVEYRRGHYCWRRDWCHKGKGQDDKLSAFPRVDDALPPNKP